MYSYGLNRDMCVWPTMCRWPTLSVVGMVFWASMLTLTGSSSPVVDALETGNLSPGVLELGGAEAVTVPAPTVRIAPDVPDFSEVRLPREGIVRPELRAVPAPAPDFRMGMDGAHQVVIPARPAPVLEPLAPDFRGLDFPVEGIEVPNLAPVPWPKPGISG